MLVEEIDPIGPQPFQRRVGDRRMCAGRLLRPASLPFSMLKPNFVAIDDLIADRLERFADQILVGERPVHFGGIEERHARGRRPPG